MDKKILAAGMQKGFVGVVVAYFFGNCSRHFGRNLGEPLFNDRRAVHKHGLH